MADCCDDNDRTLDQAYTSSKTDVRDGPLDCDGDGGEDIVSATVAVAVGGANNSDVDIGGSLSVAVTAAIGVAVAVADVAVTPRATVLNRLSSSFPPDSLSRAFITSCKG